MNRPLRKFFGTVVLLVFFAVYVVLASAIGSGQISEASKLIQFAYFLEIGRAHV